MGFTVLWCPPNYYCNQLEKKSDVESTVQAKAPHGSVKARVLCGWHESWSDGKTHITVKYEIGEKWKVAHIRRDGSMVWGYELSGS